MRLTRASDNIFYGPMRSSYISDCNGEVGGILHLMPFVDSSYLVSHIGATRGHKGHGHSTDLLKQLTSDADVHQKVLHLQLGDGSETDPQFLHSLYSKHGFEYNPEFSDGVGPGEDGAAMTRHPRS